MLSCSMPVLTFGPLAPVTPVGPVDPTKPGRPVEPTSPVPPGAPGAPVTIRSADADRIAAENKKA